MRQLVITDARTYLGNLDGHGDTFLHLTDVYLVRSIHWPEVLLSITTAAPAKENLIGPFPGICVPNAQISAIFDCSWDF